MKKTFEAESIATGRIPPQDVEAEKAVLGSILLDPSNSLPVALDLLRAESFYSSANSEIFRAVVCLRESGKPVDLVTVREELRRLSQFDSVGGAAYLNELVNCVTTSANIEAHCQIVAEKYIHRSTISKLQDGLSKSFEGQVDPFELLDGLRGELDRLVSFRKQSRAVTDAPESLQTYLGFADRLKRGEISSLKTGLPRLDGKLGGGFQHGDHVVLGGNTGIGKSSFGLQILLEVSKSVPSAYFSFELAKWRLVIRAIAQLGRLPISDVTNQRFNSREDAERFQCAQEDFSKRKLFFDCTANLTIDELCLRIEKLVQDHGVKFVVVDHIQKIATKEKLLNREREIAHISWKLTQLAMRDEIVILTVSPLNKEAESWTRPTLAHMRDSGMISYDARTILMLSNPLPDPTFAVSERRGSLIIAKQGDGGSGVAIPLVFHGDRGAYFEEASDRAEENRAERIQASFLQPTETDNVPF